MCPLDEEPTGDIEYTYLGELQDDTGLEKKDSSISTSPSQGQLALQTVQIDVPSSPVDTFISQQVYGAICREYFAQNTTDLDIHCDDGIILSVHKTIASTFSQELATLIANDYQVFDYNIELSSDIIKYIVDMGYLRQPSFSFKLSVRDRWRKYIEVLQAMCYLQVPPQLKKHCLEALKQEVLETPFDIGLVFLLLEAAFSEKDITVSEEDITVPISVAISLELQSILFDWYAGYVAIGNVVDNICNIQSKVRVVSESTTNCTDFEKCSEQRRDLHLSLSRAYQAEFRRMINLQASLYSTSFPSF
ncbi:hypothetical protein BT63DRAFT_453627 [Microthyrium microscopicum]|uniref:BTB domain-containing protein n=1 Tax=Microthyrium microscopicum TaxID=703497 RepID=A0A6A6UHE6_9PEZI|nr:hypothetical protein BT63DRAFT_453627 [Microthyrium microscopicum]